MTNATAATQERAPGAKMTIHVYTVSRSGIVSPPIATVIVPHGYVPMPEPMNTQLSPCACPVHRKAGVVR